MENRESIEEFAGKLGLTREEIRLAEEVLPGGPEYQGWRARFYQDPRRCVRALEGRADAPAFFLALYVRMAYDLYPVYRYKGIPDQVYYDTFSDIALWAAAYRERTGACGLQESEWLIWHLTLRLVRLGRLQFQTDSLESARTLAGVTFPAGTPYLQVHIPAGSPLLREECEASYRQAMAFFRGTAPLFACHSWLLSPKLSDLLPPDSRILQFAAKYQVVEEFWEDRSAEERVFGRLAGSPEEYPEKTFLQRRMKEYLRSGKRVPAALGMFCLPLEETP